MEAAYFIFVWLSFDCRIPYFPGADPVPEENLDCKYLEPRGTYYFNWRRPSVQLPTTGVSATSQVPTVLPKIET